MIESWLADADPGAQLVPIVMAGFSDSNWFRQAFGSAIVYGFCPQREMSLLEAAAADAQRRRARRRRGHRARDALLPRHRPGGPRMSPSENGASEERTVDAPGNGPGPSKSSAWAGWRFATAC